MARLASFKRLYKVDFAKEYQGLVDQLSFTINNGFESLFNALNNNISIRDNLLAAVKDVSVTVDSAGNPAGTTSFGISNANPIDGTMVIRATNKSSTTVYPTSGIFVSYTQSGNSITITNVTGLPANIPFIIRIVAFLT